ncbi:MAG TPA: type VI secretion system protein TssA [Quisquiliibacterium sp.]|nr:MAG: type VI secretion system protein TssA [Burkholderiaceae bacterium]HOA93006.1 type VI secretion system protein TssA [Quisquiliibacterium sp.]HQD81631.1 type VI secretion system protein TssA [Quisquiliibacterium sp.]HQP68112.1 type VI secretion system protein TssA [Quisquiliibacterium sp.]
MIDVDALAAPLAGDEPAGPNLEYDPDVQALEVAARGKPEQQFGDHVVPAEEPDWKDVHDRALALLERSRDLRVCTLLVRALARLDGVSGLALGIELLDRMIDGLWDSVHPQLDPDDDNDPMMRMNALAALVDADGLLRDLRFVQLASARGFGTCTVRQAEVALGLLEANDDAQLTRAQIEAMIAETVAQGAGNVAQRAVDAVQHLQQTLNARVGTSQAVDLKPLAGRLKPLVALFANADTAGEQNPDTAGADDGGDAGPHRAAAGVMISAVGEIRSRDDALRLLDKVSEFLERNEPTNPAPLLIRRARRLMTMSFVDIMREMAPEGMDSIEKIAGPTGNNDE